MTDLSDERPLGMMLVEGECDYCNRTEFHGHVILNVDLATWSKNHANPSSASVARMIDEDRERWLADLARECKCCECCQVAPCPGLQAGGFCDDRSCERGDEHDVCARCFAVYCDGACEDE